MSNQTSLDENFLTLSSLTPMQSCLASVITTPSHHNKLQWRKRLIQYTPTANYFRQQLSLNIKYSFGTQAEEIQKQTKTKTKKTKLNTIIKIKINNNKKYHYIRHLNVFLYSWRQNSYHYHTTPHCFSKYSRTSNNTHEWKTTGEQRDRESEWIKATTETGN